METSGTMCTRMGLAWILGVVLTGAAGAATTVRPTKDGTLADGGIYGPFDHVADNADWYFNASSYEGSITLAIETPPSLEHRVVWEYSLSTITLQPPVTARLYFTIRGAPVYPRPDTVVHVYSYPSDLLETLADFSSGPAVLQGSVTLAAYQDPTVFSLDVSTVVSDSLQTNSDKVAFRFQVDPGTANPTNQAFMDATDTDPTTKPYLVIDTAPRTPGDANGDGQVNLSDLPIFSACMSGPASTVPPTGCTLPQFDAADLDNDNDVDADDFAQFQGLFHP